MNFAPVVSLGTAKLLEQQGLYGDYHLLLAHQVLSQREPWRQFLAEIRSKRKIKVIMDNSIIELGQPLPEDQLLEAVHITQADYLVLPDKIDDFSTTIWRSFKGAATLAEQLPPYCSFLGVVQGRTFTECLTCAETLAHLSALGALAVPRGLPRQFRSRFELTKEVWRKTKLPIHLLGFSGMLEDDLATASLGDSFGVMGIDSAVPIREGLAERRYNYEFNRQGLVRRKPDYLDVHPTMIPDEVGINIRWVRSEIQRANAITMSA